MTKKRFLLALALMLTAVGGAWAQTTVPVTRGTGANQNQWSLTTPAGNVQLTVDYYGQYRLDSIPTTWQVKVEGTLKAVTAYTEGNTALGYVAGINETDSVELIPSAEDKPRVKSVVLVNTDVPAAPALSLTISDWATIYYNEGETWRQAITNHPTQNASWSISGSQVMYGDAWVKNVSDWKSTSPDATISSIASGYQMYQEL